MKKKNRWVTCRDPELLIRACDSWNKGRFREILWEYGNPSPSILRERKAIGWLYYENEEQAGFALGRQLWGWWRFEELWGPCEGSSSLPFQIAHQDVLRARNFKKILVHDKSRSFIRAAVDNPFANLIAREVGAHWSGGYLLATRDLQGVVRVNLPEGVTLRRFRPADEQSMAMIHSRVFNYSRSPREYLRWASSANCRTTLAILNRGVVGFLTAEKRRYQELGDFNIAVDPRFHGRGIGSALMENGLNDLIRMGCKTAVADFFLQNAKVQALNRKHGFAVVRAYNYYRVGG